MTCDGLLMKLYVLKSIFSLIIQTNPNLIRTVEAGRRTVKRHKITEKREASRYVKRPVALKNQLVTI